MDPMGRHHPRSGAFSLVGARWLFWTLSRWTTFFQLGDLLMRLSLLSLLKTSLPLLEGGWGVYSGIVVVALTQRITLQDFLPISEFPRDKS